MIVIQGWLRLAHGEIDRLRAATETMIRTARTTGPGCIEYAFAVDVLEPNLLRTFERWSRSSRLGHSLRLSAHGDFSASDGRCKNPGNQRVGLFRWRRTQIDRMTEEKIRKIGQS